LNHESVKTFTCDQPNGTAATNAAFLVFALNDAILQNLLTSRDLQLVILYTLVVMALVLTGGGRFSLDAKLPSKKEKI
jgi:hypothetical protein